jgi:hypothetical protein
MQFIKNTTTLNMERNDQNDLHDKIHPFINYATRSNGGQHVWAERKKAKQRIK